MSVQLLKSSRIHYQQQMGPNTTNNAPFSSKMIIHQSNASSKLNQQFYQTIKSDANTNRDDQNFQVSQENACKAKAESTERNSTKPLRQRRMISQVKRIDNCWNFCSPFCSQSVTIVTLILISLCLGSKFTCLAHPATLLLDLDSDGHAQGHTDHPLSDAYANATIQAGQTNNHLANSSGTKKRSHDAEFGSSLIFPNTTLVYHYDIDTDSESVSADEQSPQHSNRLFESSENSSGEVDELLVGLDGMLQLISLPSSAVGETEVELELPEEQRGSPVWPMTTPTTELPKILRRFHRSKRDLDSAALDAEQVDLPTAKKTSKRVQSQPRKTQPRIDLTHMRMQSEQASQDDSAINTNPARPYPVNASPNGVTDEPSNAETSQDGKQLAGSEHPPNFFIGRPDSYDDPNNGRGSATNYRIDDQENDLIKKLLNRYGTPKHSLLDRQSKNSQLYSPNSTNDSDLHYTDPESPQYKSHSKASRQQQQNTTPGIYDPHLMIGDQSNGYATTFPQASDSPESPYVETPTIGNDDTHAQGQRSKRTQNSPDLAKLSEQQLYELMKNIYALNRPIKQNQSRRAQKVDMDQVRPPVHQHPPSNSQQQLANLQSGGDSAPAEDVRFSQHMAGDQTIRIHAPYSPTLAQDPQALLDQHQPQPASQSRYIPTSPRSSMIPGYSQRQQLSQYPNEEPLYLRGTGETVGSVLRHDKRALYSPIPTQGEHRGSDGLNKVEQKAGILTRSLRAADSRHHANSMAPGQFILSPRTGLLAQQSYGSAEQDGPSHSHQATTLVPPSQILGFLRAMGPSDSASSHRLALAQSASAGSSSAGSLVSSASHRPTSFLPPAYLVPNYPQMPYMTSSQRYARMFAAPTRQLSASAQSQHIGRTANSGTYYDDTSTAGGVGAQSAASSDPMWSDSQNQHEQDEYQQSPQTIQITAVPNGVGLGNGFGLNGFNGVNGFNNWNGWNGGGPWNGRQVLLVNRQPTVGTEWRQWVLPVMVVLALPLVLSALFIPVFLKSVMFLIQILQMLGLLMPPSQLAGHLGASLHNSSTG